MAKRKVIKFVSQGIRQLKPGEYYLLGGTEIHKWYGSCNSEVDFDVYHRIETEEEEPRWRAEINNSYFFVSDELKVTEYKDDYSDTDDAIYYSGNYFQTEEQAQEYLYHCKKFFENN